MNEVVFKGLLKVVKNFITPEQIKTVTASIIKSGIDYKNSIPLDPEKGETQVIGIAYEVNNVIAIGFAVLDSDNRILRVENVQSLNEVTNHIIEKL